MRWMRILAALLIVAVVGAAPVVAKGKGIPIHVRVTDGDGNPVNGVDVLIHPYPLRDSGDGVITGATDKKGDFTANTDKDGNDNTAGVYRIRLLTNDGKLAETIVYFNPSTKGPIIIGLPPSSNAGATFADDAIDEANAAAERGDKDGYQTNLGAAKKLIKLQEGVLSDAQKAADAFARDNNLQSRDLAGVNKDLKRLEKAGSLGNKELEAKLREQKALLEQNQEFQRSLEKDKKRVADLDAKYGTKYGLLPSACPEGEGGGLLAGTLNAVFDADLAASHCGEVEDKGTHGNAGKNRDNEHKRP